MCAHDARANKHAVALAADDLDVAGRKTAPTPRKRIEHRKPRPAVASMDGYMLDPGNSDDHRASPAGVLSNSLGPDRQSAATGSLVVPWIDARGGTGHAGKAWAAWPAPGSVPYQALARELVRGNRRYDRVGRSRAITVNLSARAGSR